MSLDRATLAGAVAAHGTVVRVVLTEVQGSAPRDAGTAMLVWAQGQAGTIGGGALEFEAVREARAMLDGGAACHHRKALLGPDLGQCCGGVVGVLFEAWDVDAVAALGPLFARPISAGGAEPPLSVQRLLAAARRGEAPVLPRLIDGWFIEATTTAPAPVWIWGAGHVGRALVDTLAPLPELAITWLDTGPERFPDRVPEGVAVFPAPEITAAVAHAPDDAHHLVLTYSHALDLALCDALLRHGFATLGLIGSATKRARFRSRLGQMGHGDAAIARIQCPIGTKALGKHPQAIAVGVAHGLLMEMAKKEAVSPAPGDKGDSDDERALDA